MIVNKKDIMINKVLKNLIYVFYPKNISFEKEREKYFESEEYLRLIQIIYALKESIDAIIFLFYW